MLNFRQLEQRAITMLRMPTTSFASARVNVVYSTALFLYWKALVQVGNGHPSTCRFHMSMSSLPENESDTSD
ncbi:hypothetical protein KP509_12G072500 [Ceratopteris richardii]|uniref:Uncharacterized protein n=1 Tax=Ceratopteris richardii TaxID=49495 RepID=A0A8T2TPX6_CERRI|nr:hypothetical protein KP509_12G072500 [Ceratopteris richardii]